MASTPVTVTVVVATEAQLTAAFAEWEARFREDPDGFAEEFPPGRIETARAEYLVQLLKELRTR